MRVTLGVEKDVLSASMEMAMHTTARFLLFLVIIVVLFAFALFGMSLFALYQDLNILAIWRDAIATV